MNISELILKDFRNFSELNLKPDSAINIFLGRNAQGKTNILEAIHFISLGRSRASKYSELIRRGESSATIRVKFSKADVSHESAAELSAEKKSRRFLFDGNAIRFRDLVGKLNSVMFSPEDLFMFKNSPGVRRKFLDGEIVQASPVYYSNLATYNRLVEQKNNLLKKIREGFAAPDNLDLWNEQLAEMCSKVVVKRVQTVLKMSAPANSAQQNISGGKEILSVRYEVNGLNEYEREELKNILPTDKIFDFEGVTKNLAEFYKKVFRERKFSDIKRGSTSLGAHTDDLKFFLNDEELKIYGSQGQLRTAALALKLSELQFLKSETGEYPILLLDDVMSELDRERREQLLIFLRREKIQTLIAATEKTYFPEESFGKIFHVRAGQIEE